MDKDFWNERYDQGATGWDLGQISPPIKAYVDQLTNKDLKVLIPGCGFGHEAIYIAENGFTNITVIDLVPSVLNFIKAKANSIQIIEGDFFLHDAQYDLIIEQTLFCAIVPFMRENYIQHAYSCLKDGGKLVGVLFNRDFEGGPPFGGKSEDYFEQFGKVFEDVYLASCYNSVTPRMGTEVFIIAKKKI